MYTSTARKIFKKTSISLLIGKNQRSSDGGLRLMKCRSELDGLTVVLGDFAAGKSDGAEAPAAVNDHGNEARRICQRNGAEGNEIRVNGGQLKTSPRVQSVFRRERVFVAAFAPIVHTITAFLHGGSDAMTIGICGDLVQVSNDELNRGGRFPIHVL